VNKLVVIALCLGLAACGNRKKPEEQKDMQGGPVVGSAAAPAAPAPTPAPAAPTAAPAGSDPAAGSAGPTAAGSAKPTP
jgi:hypothetical protein